MKTILKKLTQMEQAQLIQHVDRLSIEEENELTQQINAIDQSILKRQRELVLNPPSNEQKTFEAFDDFADCGSIEDFNSGKKLIAVGKVGCLVLAGGQGSRLGYNGPKGLFPVSIVKQKTLFQLLAEKVLAAGQQAGRPLFLAIMTSPENDTETRNYFEKNNRFGLSKDQLFFFVQGNLPLLDAKGNLFLETRSKLAEGPDGNGHCFRRFFETGVWQQWQKAGIQYVNVVLVDNPLADPFDAELFGFHARKGSDITVKCAEKNDPTEKVGVVVKKGDNFTVVEYSEMPDVEKQARNKDGSLKHRCANLSLFCFSMDFIQRTASQPDRMPLHKAWKAVKYLAADGTTKQADQPNAWKFEAFIFDLLEETNKVSALLYPRNLCFAPLKNGVGADSLATVQTALQQRDAEIFKEVTGVTPPAPPFELSQAFYYPTPALIDKWNGQAGKSGYIE